MYFLNQDSNDMIVKQAITSCLDISINAITSFDSFYGNANNKQIYLKYSLIYYRLYPKCSDASNELLTCLESGKFNKYLKYYSELANATSTLFDAASHKKDLRYFHQDYCNVDDNNNNNDDSNSEQLSHKLRPRLVTSQNELLWHGGKAAYLNTAVSTKYDQASYDFKYLVHEDLQIDSNMAVTWDFQNEYKSGNITFEGYLNDYMNEYQQVLASGNVEYGNNKFLVNINEFSNITVLENSVFIEMSGEYALSTWNKW